MKTIFLSKTFWVQIAALLMLVFPPVKAWFQANPVEYLSALAAANVLLRFLTSGAVSILPAATPGEPDDDDTVATKRGTLPAWLLLAGLGGFMGFTLPACSPGAAQIPIRASYTENGVTVGYSSKSGLALTVDQRSGKN